MKKQYHMAMAVSLLCIACTGLAGCNNQKKEAKPTSAELQEFRGDPTKMPASMKAQIEAHKAAAQGYYADAAKKSNQQAPPASH